MAHITGTRARNMLMGLAKDNSAYLRRLERDKYQEIARAYDTALEEIAGDLSQAYWGDPDELTMGKQYLLTQQLQDRMITLGANYEAIYLSALEKGTFLADEMAQEEWAILEMSLQPYMMEYMEEEEMPFNAIDFPAVEKGLQRAMKEYRLINNAAGRVIETDLRVGMLKGESEKQLMKRLGKSLQLTKTQQQLAARRGVHTANNLARDHYIGQFAGRIPNLGKQAIASVGANTTKCCLKVHGQIVMDPSGDFELEGTPRFSRYRRTPPFHWNCRTSVVAYHPSWDRTGAATTEDMQKAAQAELDRRLHKASIAKMFPQDAITPTKWAEIFGEEAKKQDVKVKDDRPPWLRGHGTPPPGDRWFSKDDHYKLNRRFCRGIGTKDARLTSWEDRGKVKDELVRAIAKESGLDYELVNDMIRQWAHSSNDEDMRSLYIQERAAELFGAPLSPWQRGLLKTRYNAQRRSREFKNLPLGSKEETDAFLQGMYKVTQQDLAELGYGPDDKILLFRGMRMRADAIEGWEPGDVIDVRGNTMESWAFEPGVAHQFAESNITGSGGSNAGVVVAVEIPVSRIVGTARTGVGCITETEIVALGTGGSEGGGNRGRIVTIYDRGGRKHTTGQVGKGKKTEW